MTIAALRAEVVAANARSVIFLLAVGLVADVEDLWVGLQGHFPCFRSRRPVAEHHLHTLCSNVTSGDTDRCSPQAVAADAQYGRFSVLHCILLVESASSTKDRLLLKCDFGCRSWGCCDLMIDQGTPHESVDVGLHKVCCTCRRCRGCCGYRTCMECARTNALWTSMAIAQASLIIKSAHEL